MKKGLDSQAFLIPARGVEEAASFQGKIVNCFRRGGESGGVPAGSAKGGGFPGQTEPITACGDIAHRCILRRLEPRDETVPEYRLEKTG